MEQISMFDENESKKTNSQIFYDNVSDILKASERTELKTRFYSNKSYDVIEFDEHSPLLIRVHFVEKKYFELPARYSDFLKPGQYIPKKSEDWIRIYIDSPKDVYYYKELLYKLYDTKLAETSPDSFDCCSRYEECSNEKRCVNPYPNLQKYCKYRLKLAKGIIFYGKNRTVE